MSLKLNVEVVDKREDELVKQSVGAWSTRIDRWSKMQDVPTWDGRGCLQFTADLWRYAELAWRLKPPFILETGTAGGGTACFLADVLKAIGHGVMISIDLHQMVEDDRSNLFLLSGDSVDPTVIGQVEKITDGRRGLILLDGDHGSKQVAAELEAYADIAEYLVVQDMIMRWLPGFNDGPYVAVDEWLPEHPEWENDDTPLLGPTQHPGGWLKRVAD